METIIHGMGFGYGENVTSAILCLGMMRLTGRLLLVIVLYGLLYLGATDMSAMLMHFHHWDYRIPDAIGIAINGVLKQDFDVSLWKYRLPRAKFFHRVLELSIA